LPFRHQRGDRRRSATPDDLNATAERCEQLIRSDDDGQFELLAEHYGYLRQFTPAVLEALDLHSNRDGDPLIAAVELLRHESILAQACNFGLTRMARIADLSYSKLAWHSTWYLREETLTGANTKIVNAHFRHPLTRLWGGGTMSSSDGQRFPVPVQARNATAIPRYFGFGRGLTFYSWTSDQFSQYGCKQIPSTMRDARFVLDGFLGNETELPIDEHTTDHAGYSDLLFGVGDLLGVQLCPRLSDLGDKRLYRFDKSIRYGTIGPLLRKTIRTDRILNQWDDLLRVARSLKLGWVTASLFIGKLQSYRRQNALARGFQEYGRVVKTIFILRYLEDEAFRRRIGAQLNKGESLHALRNFLFLANLGQIRRRALEDQANQALCLTVVTNAVILWNTVYMARVLEQLRAEGPRVFRRQRGAPVARALRAHQPLRALPLRRGSRQITRPGAAPAKALIAGWWPGSSLDFLPLLRGLILGSIPSSQAASITFCRSCAE